MEMCARWWCMGWLRQGIGRLKCTSCSYWRPLED